MNAAIALVGDFDESCTAHQAIPVALRLARAATGVHITWSWVGTNEIDSNSDPPFLPRQRTSLTGFAAVWLVPGSPYASMAGALTAIRFTREMGRPFLGTCGGFQHALIEFARNVCLVYDADHEETNPGAGELVVTRLATDLVEKTGGVTFTPGSRLHAIFDRKPTTEEYHCNYGLNPAWRARLETGGLRFTGFDESGDVRAGELPGHPFFIGTLFQPERSALRGERHPLITAFVRAVAET
jgi:CTP synthase (UTP-ammonia lyase)